MAVTNWFRSSLSTDQANLEKLYGPNTVECFQAIFLANLGRSFGTLLLIAHLVLMFPGLDLVEPQIRLIWLGFIGVIVGLLYLSVWQVERGHIRAARWITNLTLLVSSVLSVIMCGGFTKSHATAILLLPFVVAFITAPRREATLIGLLAFAIPLGFEGLSQAMGWTIPNLTSQTNPAMNMVFLMAVLFASFYVALAHFQNFNQRLTSILEREKSAYAEKAEMDVLTGLGNRRYFDRQLASAREKADSTDSSFAVLFLDLNDFKPVNDAHGHETGDRVLQKIAERLAAGLRQGDCVARMGGDEFAVIMRSSGTTTDVEHAKARLRDLVEVPIELDGRVHKVSCAVGHAVYPEHGVTVQELLRQADSEMYAAKPRRAKASASSREAAE